MKKHVVSSDAKTILLSANVFTKRKTFVLFRYKKKKLFQRISFLVLYTRAAKLGKIFLANQLKRHIILIEIEN